MYVRAVDPIAEWNWQRRAMVVVAMIGVAISAANPVEGEPWMTAAHIGVALLVAFCVRLLIWILPAKPPSDRFALELFLLLAGAILTVSLVFAGPKRMGAFGDLVPPAAQSKRPVDKPNPDEDDPFRKFDGEPGKTAKAPAISSDNPFAKFVKPTVRK